MLNPKLCMFFDENNLGVTRKKVGQAFCFNLFVKEHKKDFHFNP